jgi:carboxylate-amine ligase
MAVASRMGDEVDEIDRRHDAVGRATFGRRDEQVADTEGLERDARDARSVVSRTPARRQRQASYARRVSRLAPAADVLDHRFGGGEPMTLGVEEEYMLLDADTFDLVQRVESILRAEAEGEFASLVAPELFESLVEFHTPVCRNVAEVEHELRRVRAHAVGAAGAQGLRLGSAGTHPFSLFEAQRVTGRDRYRALVDELRYVAQRELIFGLHVHVAVDDPERAVRLIGALEPHICELVALSANSPFWRGKSTGFASSRHLIFSAFPRSGPPPRFRSYGEFADVVAQLVESGCIDDYTRIWWDIRPHPRLGTVEVRVMDAVSRVEDAVALAAYVQALVRRYAAADESGKTLPACHPVLTHESKWQAARHGLRATVIDFARGGPVPVARIIERTLDELAPHARELGSERELDGIRRILREGNGADRQLRVHAANDDTAEVVRDIATVTQTI